MEFPSDSKGDGNDHRVVLCAQLWHFQPGVQRAVNASLRELKGLNNPTVAFHIRGGDLSADLQNNVRCPPCTSPAMFDTDQCRFSAA